MTTTPKATPTDRGRVCPICRRAETDHEPGDYDLELLGRARMAGAREAAGQPLDRLDVRALSVYPNPGRVGADA